MKAKRIIDLIFLSLVVTGLIAAVVLYPIFFGQSEKPQQTQNPNNKPSISQQPKFDRPFKNLFHVRENYKTKIIHEHENQPDNTIPPADVFEQIQYNSNVGPLKAWLTKPKDKNKKYPAIIWIVGGFPAGGVGEFLYQPIDKSNDQSAQSFQNHNIITLYPTFRGTYGNPGQREDFYGEASDVISALAYLKKHPNVDPKQIYLAGHSTGGTLALLAAAATKDFKAVFSFGPAQAPSDYGQESLAYNIDNLREDLLRSPIEFLAHITSPTYIIEGRQGNRYALQELQERNTENPNPDLHFMLIPGNHFNILYNANETIAKKINQTKAHEKFKLNQNQLE